MAFKQIAETLAGLIPGLTIEWDVTKPSGDRKRLMDMARARAIGFAPQVSLEEGMAETLAWYPTNRDTAGQRYNAFTEAAHALKAGAS